MALIVKSAVGDAISKKGMRTSGTFYDAIDKAVMYKIEQAVRRAKANGRKTVTDADL